MGRVSEQDVTRIPIRSPGEDPGFRKGVGMGAAIASVPLLFWVCVYVPLDFLDPAGTSTLSWVRGWLLILSPASYVAGGIVARANAQRGRRAYARGIWTGLAAQAVIFIVAFMALVARVHDDRF
jgi:hypothetical protein